MLGLGTMRRFAVTVRRRLSPRGVILLYHRVGVPRRDPQQLAVSPTHFAEQLAVMSAAGTPLALAEFERRRRNGTLPARAIAVTFDDGYVDNLNVALPLLRRAAIPATLFVATGSLGQPFGFWWDELDALLNAAPVVERLSLPVPFDDGGPGSIDLAPGDEFAVYLALCSRFRAALPDARARVLATLRETLGRGLAAALAEDAPPRTCSAAELRAFADSGVTIGAHGVTHTTMSRQSPVDLAREVFESRDTLREILGTAPTEFAYPFGTWGDISSEAVDAVQTAGFSMACANFPGAAWRGSDQWRAPRFIVRDWERATFASHLDAWFDA